VDLAIQKAVSDRDFEIARILFQEYQASIPLDLGFQNFGGFPARQVRGAGWCGAGCVAVRPLAAVGVCQLKRLFVRPEARGTGLGRKLLNEAISLCPPEGLVSAPSPSRLRKTLPSASRVRNR